MHYSDLFHEIGSELESDAGWLSPIDCDAPLSFASPVEALTICFRPKRHRSP